MNCLSHAFRYLDDPYFAAGACIPDWLGMVDRRVRVRRSNAIQYLAQASDCPASHALVSGIVQHLDDDVWFHANSAFLKLSHEIARLFADCPDDPGGHRAGLVGHLSVELLLDACIEESNPGTMERYYQVMSEVCKSTTQATINQLANRPTENLEPFMHVYIAEKFLLDYLDDARLLYRLNRITNRVRLAPISDDYLDRIAQARDMVRAHQQQLLCR